MNPGSKCDSEGAGDRDAAHDPDNGRSLPAFVRAVAARAGVLCGKPESDFGLDLFIRGVEQEGRQYTDTGPQVDIQLKSTTRAAVLEEEIVYDLEVRAYNLLRRPSASPRILVLLVLPEDERLWMRQSEDELILRHCAYWLSLADTAPTTNEATVRIRIPRSNVFSVDAVRSMTTHSIPEATP